MIINVKYINSYKVIFTLHCYSSINSIVFKNVNNLIKNTSLLFVLKTIHTLGEIRFPLVEGLALLFVLGSVLSLCKRAEKIS